MHIAGKISVYGFYLLRAGRLLESKWRSEIKLVTQALLSLDSPANGYSSLEGSCGGILWGFFKKPSCSIGTREAGVLPNLLISSPTSPNAQQNFYPKPWHPMEPCKEDMCGNSLLSHPSFQRPNLCPEKVPIKPPPFWIVYKNHTLGSCIASKWK